eukprot:768104-Hanusia_phi.AAC.4
MGIDHIDEAIFVQSKRLVLSIRTNSEEQKSWLQTCGTLPCRNMLLSKFPAVSQGYHASEQSKSTSSIFLIPCLPFV